MTLAKPHFLHYRYGFVLERCVQSMAKHWSQYFEVGHSSIESNIDWWNETAATRESLPTNSEVSGQKRPSEPRDVGAASAFDGYGSVKSAMRKSQSIDASTGSLGDPTNSTYRMSRPRTMSEHSLTSSPQQNTNSNATVVTALYGYMSSGENQLSFLEGDKILLIGEETQGWKFGENIRTNTYGWFPISYVHHEPER
jgi:BAI1-associated protein 2